MGVSLWRPRTKSTAQPAPCTLEPETQIPELCDRSPPAASVPSVTPADTNPRGKSVDANGSIAAMDWESLRAAVAHCRACALCETRTQTVFGVGDPQADLMIIGEAPGADEDRAGEPFVGRAGQLLTRMLQAIGLERDRVFIANILKCRPPGNRDPRPEEVRACELYLARQIELVSPRVILSVGRVSAQCLLRTDAPIGRLRGRWHRLGATDRPLYVTYHPAYLLRSPAQKAAAWQDLVAVAQRLRA